MMDFRFAFLFFILLLLSACERVLDVRFQQEDLLLTGYAYLSADDTSSVILVDRTLQVSEFFDRNQARLNGPAEVELYRDGQLIALFQQRFETADYVADHPPLNETGAVYQLRVRHPDFPDLRAESRVPARASSLQVERLETYQLAGGQTVAEVLRITFDDPPAAGDFYEMRFEHISEPAPHFVEPLRTNLLEIRAGDRVISAGQAFQHLTYDNWLFNDDELNGRPVQLIFEQQEDVFNEGTVFLVFRNITREQYEFVAFLRSEDRELPYPFSANQVVYTNVEGGFGLFAIYQEQRLVAPE